MAQSTREEPKFKNNFKVQLKLVYTLYISTYTVCNLLNIHKKLIEN